MSYNSKGDITVLLNQLVSDDSFELDSILPIVYNELKKISSKYLKNEYRNHTFQTTELVHEAYIKLIGTNPISWESRSHFYGIAARSMRQILVDHARKRKSIKRGEGKTVFSLEDLNLSLNTSEDQLLNLNDALTKLEEDEERAAKIIELRFFAGLSIEETAQILSISVATVKRDWKFAKAWLYREIH